MTKPLKILLDARMIGPQIHGIARYTVDLARQLSTRGHAVSIISHSGDEKKIIGEKHIKGEVKCLAGFATVFEPAALSLISAYAQFDVVHFTSFAVPLLVPPNAIITIHDLIHLYTPLKLAKRAYFHTVLRRALVRCRHVITVSEWTRQELCEKLKISQNKISVVRNGVDENWFCQREKSGESQNKPYFLCIGNVKPHKNIKTLVRACHDLWAKGADFKLHLVLGAGKIPQDWEISKDDIKHLIFYNRLPDDELRKLFKSAIALVSPSLYEGYNYPAAESLAMGVPAILSSGSAHDEMNIEGVSFYGQPTNSDALGKCLLNHLHSCPGAGSKTGKPPTLTQMTDQTLLAYRHASPLY